MAGQMKDRLSSSLRVILGTAAKYSLKSNGFSASQDANNPTAKQEHRTLCCLHLSQLLQIAELYAYSLKYLILIHFFPHKLVVEESQNVAFF